MSRSHLKYFTLYDDMSTDQRWYLDDPAGPRGRWLGTALTSASRYEGPTPLSCRVHRSGPPLELTMTLDDVPILNERVAEIFAAHVGRDAQLIPARASESDAKLWAVNVLAAPACVDELRSEEIRRYTVEDGFPDRIGEYSRISGLKIDAARAGGHAILRPWGWSVKVIVGEPLAKALRKARVRCELKLIS